MLEGAKGTSGHERFASRAAHCEIALSELEERIKVLSIVQRKWIYLDPVYGSGAAPNDSGKWSRADKEFRFIIPSYNFLLSYLYIIFKRQFVSFCKLSDILSEKYLEIPEYHS